MFWDIYVGSTGKNNCKWTDIIVRSLKDVDGTSLEKARAVLRTALIFDCKSGQRFSAKPSNSEPSIGQDSEQYCRIIRR